MPRPAERVIFAWKADADADAAVRGDYLEDNVKGRVGDWILGVVRRLGNGNEQDCEGDPPDVMTELGAELLVDEVAARALDR
ncbi:hypothetical protein GB937_010553 [Aspergillus fischeri]|nr:hypothetical protein GB937_010553 [Aspergillus fischeri]